MKLCTKLINNIEFRMTKANPGPFFLIFWKILPWLLINYTTNRILYSFGAKGIYGKWSCIRYYVTSKSTFFEDEWKLITCSISLCRLFMSYCNSCFCCWYFCSLLLQREFRFCSVVSLSSNSSCSAITFWANSAVEYRSKSDSRFQFLFSSAFDDLKLRLSN